VFARLLADFALDSWVAAAMRWIALAFTLLCLFTCSFTSTNAWRGVVAPIGFALGGLVTILLFAGARAQAALGGKNAAMLRAELAALTRRREAEQAAQQSEEKR
jgi:hypothetical protein